MSFAWSAPDACPSAPDVQARIERRLGAALELGDHELAVTVTREGDAFVARISLDGEDPRTLTAAGCDQLADAVAVIAGRLATERQAEVAARAAAPVRAEVPAQVHRSEPPRIAARVAGAGVVGILPGASVGAELGAIGEHGPFSVELALVQWVSRSQPVMDTFADHVDVGLRAFAVRAGYRVGPLPVRATADIEAGTMTAQAARSGSGTWLAVGLGLAGWWQATASLRVVVAAEADLARDRVRFTLGNGSLAYEPGLASGRATLGLEVQIP